MDESDVFRYVVCPGMKLLVGPGSRDDDDPAPPKRLRPARVSERLNPLLPGFAAGLVQVEQPPKPSKRDLRRLRATKVTSRFEHSVPLGAVCGGKLGQCGNPAVSTFRHVTRRPGEPESVEVMYLCEHHSQNLAGGGFRIRS